MVRKIDTRSNLQKARDAWGSDIEPWVIRLAEVCDLHNQPEVARKIKLSVAVVSQGIHNKYGRDGKGRIETLSEAVETHLMEAQVRCPGLKRMMLKTECEGYWQVSAVGEFGSGHVRQQMAGACRACPHSKLKEEI